MADDIPPQPLHSICFVFKYGDGTSEAFLRVYPTDGIVRHLRELLMQEEGPIPLGKAEPN